MVTNPYAGYPGQVWRTAYASLAWLAATAAAADNAPAAVAEPTAVVFQTLRNAVDAVSAYSTLASWKAEIVDFQTIQTLPLFLDTTTAAYFNARIATYQAAVTALGALIPAVNPATVAALLSQGTPAVPDPGLLNFYAAFNFETPPAGAEVPAAFSGFAQASATAWQTVANAVLMLQGSLTTTAYDTAVRQQEVGQSVANRIAAWASGLVYNTGSAAQPWNTLVVLPLMLADAAAFDSAPYDDLNQQSGVIRYALLTAANQLALLLLSLRQPAIGVTNLATLLNNDTLLDFANRNTGDFENWTGIASANGLLPPWTGPAGAAYGSQLFIPAPGTAAPTPGVAQPTYAANVLGTDYYFGPLNGDMPAWTGDYQLITGYQNLAISLGRRLQTTLGTLVYHSDFGSRIPPEVGNVQDTLTAGHIAAYGQSALLSDPRTGSVVSATATIPAGGLGLVSFNGLVLPIGQNSDAVEINQVISPLA